MTITEQHPGPNLVAKVRFTDHALQRLRERGIHAGEVLAALGPIDLAKGPSLVAPSGAEGCEPRVGRPLLVDRLHPNSRRERLVLRGRTKRGRQIKMIVSVGKENAVVVTAWSLG